MTKCNKCGMPELDSGLDRCYCEPVVEVSEEPPVGIINENSIFFMDSSKVPIANWSDIIVTGSITFSKPVTKSYVDHLVFRPGTWMKSVDYASQLQYYNTELQYRDSAFCFVKGESRCFVWDGEQWMGLYGSSAAVGADFDTDEKESLKCKT